MYGHISGGSNGHKLSPFVGGHTVIWADKCLPRRVLVLREQNLQRLFDRLVSVTDNCVTIDEEFEVLDKSGSNAIV